MDGLKEYHEQRALFVRLDDLLSQSGLEGEFFTLRMAHRKIDLSVRSAAEVQSLSRSCTLALRSNLARLITGLNHRNFCIRLADSSLLQWFLQVGRVDGVSTFAKSTSDRFAHFIDADSLQKLNVKLIEMLQQGAQCDFGLENAVRFDAVFFDSTCLKAPVHHPVDWVLLRDATRTLMKAVDRIRKKGLLVRMPKAPLLFLSEMNTLCMAMSAKHRTSEGKKHRKKVLRQMKALLHRIKQHAQRHLNRLKELGENTDLSPGQIQRIITDMENVIEQVPWSCRVASSVVSLCSGLNPKIVEASHHAGEPSAHTLNSGASLLRDVAPRRLSVARLTQVKTVSMDTGAMISKREARFTRRFLTFRVSRCCWSARCSMRTSGVTAVPGATSRQLLCEPAHPA